MRQLKNCKVGSIVKYNGKTVQVNCFFTTWRNGERLKMATLIQVEKTEGINMLLFVDATKKVETIK